MTFCKGFFFGLASFLCISNVLAQDSSGVSLVGRIDFENGAYDVAIVEDLAYVVGSHHLTIVDISDPATPQSIGTLRLGQFNNGICIQGQFAYVAAGWGLVMVDISDPTDPHQTGTFDSPGFAFGVAVAGNYVYLADGDSEIRVINIENPGNLREVGFLDNEYHSAAIALDSVYTYVTNGENGIVIVDVSEPTQPTEIGSVAFQGYAYGIQVSGNFAYIATQVGLRIINKSNPNEPWATGLMAVPGRNVNLSINGDYSYMVNENYGLYMANISGAYEPVRVGSYETSDEALGVARSQDGNACIANRTFLGIYDCTVALSSVSNDSYQILPSRVLSLVYPNPFNSTTHFQFDMPKSGHALVSVFGMDGREVAT